MLCPKCGTDNEAKNVQCVQCGEALKRPQPESDFDLSEAEQSAAMPPPNPMPYPPPATPLPYSNAPGQMAYGAPPAQAPYAPPAPLQAGVNLVDSMVPANNPSALISYYLGIFSILPLIGIFMGIAAVVLGIKGLKQEKANPAIRGRTHAWVGIVTGILFGGLWLALTLFIVIALMFRPSGGYTP